jgi:S1-C subfamily serine protease
MLPCRRLILPVVLLLCVPSSGYSFDNLSASDSPRRTATVRLVESALPATVTLQNIIKRDDGSYAGSSGSGLVIDPRGYVLTNNHVIPAKTVRHRIVLPNGQTAGFELIARYPFADIALVRIPKHESLRALKIGRSHDLMLGEPALVIGSPDGLTNTVSTGIISGLQRGTKLAALGESGLIQTSAPSGHGGSGGPLLNALGDVIGIVSSGRDHVDNVTFAIPADRIRLSFPDMLVPEARYGFHLGMTVDMLAEKSVVQSVEPDSPAQTAGLMTGDIVTRIDGGEIRDGLEFWLALVDAKAGTSLAVEVQRGGQTLTVEVKLGRHKRWPATDEPEKLVSGLRATVYEGLWERLPDFASLEPVERAVAKTVTLDVTKRRDHVGIVFEGFVKVPYDGLYLFGLSSDDGSRLIIDGKTVVNLDGPHPAIEHGTQLSLDAGLHSLRIEFFEAEGKEVVETSVQSDKVPPQPLPANWLFHTDK